METTYYTFISCFLFRVSYASLSQTLYRVFHLRTTILPAEEEMPAIMDSFKKFNDDFMEQYDDHRGYSRL